MAIVHIDFGAAGGGNGSFATPYNYIPAFASDNDYYIKRGGNPKNLGSATYAFSNLSNVTLGAYYDNDGSAAYDNNSALAKPAISMYFTSTVTGDWVEVGTTNVYEYTHGATEYNPHAVLGLTTLGDRGNHNWPHRANYYGGNPNRTSGAAACTIAGQWDYTVGSGSVAPKVAIYSPAGNPATVFTTIYLSKAQDRFYITNASDNIIIENLNLKYFFGGVDVYAGDGITNSDCIIRNNELDHCWYGMNTSAINTQTGKNENFEIYGNYIYDSGSVGIGINQRHDGSRVYGNYIYRTGHAASIGGIYGRTKGSLANPLLIYKNYVDTVYDDGEYWEFEFRCYYSETTSEYVTWSKNYGKNAANAGLCSNGGMNGGGPVIFEGNIIEDCDLGITETDALPQDNGTSVYFNNTFNRVRTGISAWRPASATTASITVKNNVFISDGGSGTGIVVSTDLQAIGGITEEDHNIVHGFSTDSSNHTFGDNTITEDPQLNDDNFPNPQGPCIGSGTTLLSTYDFHSRPKIGTGNHIGAKWPKLGGSSVRRKL